jgi:DNA-binding response OmpR family regulator
MKHKSGPLVQMMHRLGAIEIITKPFDPVSFIERVKTLKKSSDEQTPFIVLADDDKMTSDMLKLWLTIKGFETVCLGNGLEVLEFVSNCLPDIILLDMEMPGLNGYETCKAMRDNFSTTNVTIIAISGHTDDASINKAMDSGCDHYFTKPLDFPELLELLQSTTKAKSLVKSAI